MSEVCQMCILIGINPLLKGWHVCHCTLITSHVTASLTFKVIFSYALIDLLILMDISNPVEYPVDVWQNISSML